MMYRWITWCWAQ